MSRGGAAVVLASVVGVALVLLAAPDIPTAPVPDVVGVRPDEAVIAVRGAGFETRIVPVCESDAGAVASAYTVERNLWWSRAAVVVDAVGVTESGRSVPLGETVYLEVPDPNACPRP